MPKSKIILFIIVGIAFVGLIILGVVSSSKQTEVNGLPTLPKKPAIPPAEVPSEVPPTALPGVPGEAGPEVPPASPSEEPGEVPGEVPAEGLPPEIPAWEKPEVPAQSPPMQESEIPREAVKIDISATGFSPSSFTVKKGTEVVLSVTSQDQWTHVFKFRDSTLATVAVGLSSGETRIITFYAPKQAGDYEFFCDVPGHEARGEKGTMIVK